MKKTNQKRFDDTDGVFCVRKKVPQRGSKVSSLLQTALAFTQSTAWACLRGIFLFVLTWNFAYFSFFFPFCLAFFLVIFNTKQY